MVKKVSKAKLEKELKLLKRECLRLWTAVVKINARGRCEYCGVKKRLHSHHIESFSVNKALRYNPTNGIALCLTHHKFGRISAHKSFIMMHLLMQDKKIHELEYLINHYKDKEDLSKEYLEKQIIFLENLLPEKLKKKKKKR